MKKEYKDKQLAALRSGAYQQGRQCLRTENNEFCCLGVLCDIVNPKKQEEEYSGDQLFGYTMEGKSFFPPSSVYNAVAFCTSFMTLSDMNDKEKKSFSDIANWIEENIPETP